jgi:histone deacetylase 6
MLLKVSFIFLKYPVELHFLTSHLIPAFDHNSACEECATTIENWICLLCFKTLCSRYINEHSALHSISSEHPLALSFMDLSVWCHQCDAYIDNSQLYKFKNLAHRSKFGEDLVWSYGAMTIDLTQDDDSE